MLFQHPANARGERERPQMRIALGLVEAERGQVREAGAQVHGAASSRCCRWAAARDRLDPVSESQHEPGSFNALWHPPRRRYTGATLRRGAMADASTEPEPAVSTGRAVTELSEAARIRLTGRTMGHHGPGGSMKTLGILGGIGPEATIDYYRQLVAAYREQSSDGGYPSLLINSIDLQKVLALVSSGERAALTRYLVDEFRRLGRAGADVGLMASNTPHLVFRDVQQLTPFPLISIVEATRDAVSAAGLRRVGLIGTRFTMQGGFYHEVCGAAGIELVIPTAPEQDEIHQKYMDELVPGVFLPQTRARLLAILRRMRDQQGIEGVILGGTELPLLFRDGQEAGLPFFDTTTIHVERAIAELVS